MKKWSNWSSSGLNFEGIRPNTLAMVKEIRRNELARRAAYLQCPTLCKIIKFPKNSNLTELVRKHLFTFLIRQTISLIISRIHHFGIYYTNILTRAIYLTLKWLRNQICSNGGGRFLLNLLEFLVRIDSGNSSEVQKFCCSVDPNSSCRLCFGVLTDA